MTGILKFLTLGLWILILTVWIGVLWVGIPIDVSDDVTRGIVEPTTEHMQDAVKTRRMNTTLALIPALIIFGLVTYGIRKRNNRLFYIGMILTIIPLLTIGILGLTQESEMPYKNIIMTVITVPLTIGLVKGLKEIFKRTENGIEKKIKN